MTIDFKDCIHHTTTSKFPFWQRVRHLLGAPVVVKSELKTENVVGHIDCSSDGVKTRIFKRKDKGGVTMMAPNSHREALLNRANHLFVSSIIKKDYIDNLERLIKSPDDTNMDLAEQLIEIKEEKLYGK